jgi:hypothetical protein
MEDNTIKVLEAVKVPAGPIRTSGGDLSELFSALCDAQKELSNVARDAENPYFSSKYATLASVVDAVRGTLADHGLIVMQWPTNTVHGVGVITRVCYSSGQWMEHTFSAVPKDHGPQASGSVITYLCRYSLCSIFMVAPEDDDAEAATSRGSDAAKPAARVRPQEIFSGASDEDPENPFSAERFYAKDEKQVMAFAFRKDEPKVPVFLCTPEQLRGKKKYAEEKKWKSWVDAIDREIGRRQAYAKHEKEVQDGAS